MSDKPKAGFANLDEFTPTQTGFTSREPKRRSRATTGRNQQLNIKATAKVVEQFNRLADQNGWSLVETFEHALAALEKDRVR